MKHLLAILAASAVVLTGEASWYWPFGSDDDEADVPRLSELMEPVTELIDEASDLASEGNVSESVEKYREALKELDSIERDNPERAKAPEFATLRTKRAYVTAAIDSLLMTQARDNAKPVAVSDTAELEKKLAAERNGNKKETGDDENLEPAQDKVAKKPAKSEKKAEEPEAEEESAEPARPLTRNEQIIRDISARKYESAANAIAVLLNEKPNDATGLNLKAALEASKGEWREAEHTLDQAIMSNPRSHYAYYNMAKLLIKTNPSNKSGARRYYETGRALGGAQDAELEEAIK